MSRRHGPGRPRPTPERGAVTAELALGLPLLLSVVVGMVWLLAAGAAQVRVVDASRETARAIARGEGDAAATALGRRIAPPGATVRVHGGGEEVRVVTTATVGGPGGLFAVLPDVVVEAESVAVVEESW